MSISCVTSAGNRRGHCCAGAPPRRYTMTEVSQTAGSPVATKADLESLVTKSALKLELEAALEPYATKADLAAALEPYATKADLAAALEPYATKADLAAALEPYATKAGLEQMAAKLRAELNEDVTRHINALWERSRWEQKVLLEGLDTKRQEDNALATA